MGLKRFDFKLKDNSKKKSIIVASIIVLVLLIGVTIYATYAAYKVTNTYNIIQGKVKEFVNADIGITVKTIATDGTVANVDNFPSYLEYSYVSSNSTEELKSNCTNGSTIEFDESKWSATISSSTKDKCTLYFEQRSDKTLSAAIKANTTLIEETPDFSIVATDENTNLYQAEDDLGTSYYFRGAATNNYVQFGKNVDSNLPMYWRIIRINGDGTVRLIYDGTEKIANGTIHTATVASTTYNTNGDDTKHVGYTYDDGTGKQIDSTIKGVVDTWYDKHLETNYGSYIEDGIFCNDRSEEMYDENFMVTFFAPYYRLSAGKAPVLNCSNKDDRYTVEDTTKGNGYLSNPVGLLTADEAIMAGGTNESNKSFYLYSGEVYWTSTPNGFGGLAIVWYVNGGSGIHGNPDVTYNYRVRPVINLDANIKLYGSGTINDPYRLTKEL